MQINIHKLIVIVHSIFESQSPYFATIVSPNTVSVAIQLLNFYRLNFGIICEEYQGSGSKKIDIDPIIQLGFENGASMEDIGRVIGKNKSTVSRRLAKLK